MFESVIWQSLHLLRPMWLLALLPLVAVVYWRWRGEQQKNNWLQLLPPHLYQALTVGKNSWQQQLPLKALLVLCIIVIIILAGPSWQRQPSPFSEDKAPVLIVLDVSSSMDEADLMPSRLQRAKLKIEDLLVQRDGGNTGLIVYAGSAHLAMPLTEDVQVFKPLLHAIGTEIMPRDGKAAEQALAIVDKQFSSAPVPGSVVLLTDGIGGNSEQAFVDYFHDSPHQLLILATANPDAYSQIPMDLASIKRLADATGGRYKTLTVDDGDIRWLDNQIARHMQISLDQALPWKDSGYPLVFVAALIFILWFRRGWLVQWCFVAVVTSSMLLPEQAMAAAEQPEQIAEVTESVPSNSGWRFADIWLTPDQQGQWYFQRQQYDTAAARFDDAMWKGTAYYYAENYPAAYSYFLRDGSDQGMFNAANALANMREYVAAKNLLDGLLKRQPNFPSAQNNRDELQKIIDDINRMSESQSSADSIDEFEASTELGDKPQTADGTDEETFSPFLKEQKLTADDILADESMNKKWMNRVQTDPAVFLRNKFGIQLQRQDEGGVVDE
ncbi:hypothetical protein SIN8267_02695 [Sinobacterium norvegicum]|uniref:VWFA domain-containing protein n=1 Tax=Sinobacterium norvegicum TaxID=1641715 RepID=A0ABN8EME0_9GAMM|nr:VWA domain-containing protein [Sinobacterium norvegicum]CAH0992562.1 hypothetical protein SIN8267_02695 [Sinobacterium norvegicum]